MVNMFSAPTPGFHGINDPLSSCKYPLLCYDDLPKLVTIINDTLSGMKDVAFKIDTSKNKYKLSYIYNMMMVIISIRFYKKDDGILIEIRNDDGCGDAFKAFYKNIVKYINENYENHNILIYSQVRMEILPLCEISNLFNDEIIESFIFKNYSEAELQNMFINICSAGNSKDIIKFINEKGYYFPSVLLEFLNFPLLTSDEFKLLYNISLLSILCETPEYHNTIINNFLNEMENIMQLPHSIKNHPSKRLVTYILRIIMKGSVKIPFSYNFLKLLNMFSKSDYKEIAENARDILIIYNLKNIKIPQLKRSKSHP